MDTKADKTWPVKGQAASLPVLMFLKRSSSRDAMSRAR